MYPATFEYVAPESLDEVLALLSEHGDEAKPLAGGQSLIPLLKLRFAEPELLVDLNRVPGLDQVADSNGHVVMGALTRHSTLLSSPFLAERFPILPAAAQMIADPLVRNLGSLGGSLAHADPAGDIASVMLALRAEVVATSSGQRTISMRDFLDGPFTTALEPNELLTEIHVPRPAGPSGGTYLALERKVGDFVTAGAAVQLELNGGSIARAGIALTGVAPQNTVATEAEEALAGAAPGPEVFDEAARLAAGAAQPHGDLRGSVAYKREVVRVFVRRGLDQALELARVN